ncbi:MAG: lytic transglycosylase domain-containing protein [Victivallaceae bacterium]
MSRKRRHFEIKRKLLFLLLAVVIGVVVVFHRQWRDWLIDDSKYDEIIASAAKKYGVDGRLIKAVIYRESRFEQNARGRAGEIGLMQIMPGRAAVDWTRYYNTGPLNTGTIFSPVLNIEIGTWYLARALKKWNHYKYATELALCQYNAGERRADEWKPATYDGDVIDRIKIKSTRGYVEAIMDKYRKYREKDK